MPGSSNWPFLLFGIFFLGVILLALISVVRHAFRPRAFGKLSNEHVRFDESWASGSSDKSLMTRFGGANNCLRITVTDEEVWIRPNFPFSIFAHTVDLEHRVHAADITSLRSAGRALELSFRTADESDRTVSLVSRKSDALLVAICGITGFVWDSKNGAATDVGPD